jgi:hypothetical protein
MSLAIAGILSAVTPVLSQTLKRLFPDPDQAANAEREIIIAFMKHKASIEAQAGQIIQAEASSETWLTSSWRPITMLIFVGLITARWFGWSAPGLSDAEALALWEIVKLGLGGYVIGRTAEKITPPVLNAIKR